jgi:hypothetical protein
VHHTPASCSAPRVLNLFFPSCSIAESAVASFAVPAPSIQHPSSTRRRFPLCILRVVPPLLRTHPLPRLFSLHACATRATPKSTVLLPPTRLLHRPHQRHHLHPLLGPPLRAGHGLSQHRHHRILHSPMTCGITLFGSGPIFARPPEAGGGRLNPRLFLIT